MSRPLHCLCLACLLAVGAGCTRSFHGSYTPSTFRGGQDPESVRQLGAVEGRSCQVQVLYVLPRGERASTDQAIKDALGQIGGTGFLVDVSIDDESYFGIGYSKQCIVVHATAMGSEVTASE